MNEDKLISIIVPFKNEEKFLGKCIDSITGQTYSNLEILVVVDHSSESSVSFVNKIAKKDSRIVPLILTKQKGAQAARFEGLENARGERIMFVDSDDLLRPQAVELLSAAMDNYDVDLVQMRFIRRFYRFNWHYKESYDPHLSEKRIEGDEYMRLSSYVGMESLINPSLWGKLYRTPLLRILKPTPFEQFWGDDQICNIDYLRLARSMAFIDYVGYIYRWGGRTSKFEFSNLEKYKNVYRLKLKLGQDPDSLRKELHLLLRYYIRQMNTELGWTRDALIIILKKELEDPLWEGIISIDEIETLVDKEFSDLHQSAFKTIIKRLLR